MDAVSRFLGNVHPAGWLGLIGARQEFLANPSQFLGQVRLQLAFADAINAGRMSAPRCQRDASRFREPGRVGYQSEQTVKPSGGILGGPCR